jgi:hypothetical protein
MSKDESINIEEEVSTRLEQAVADAIAKVASVAGSSGTSTGNVQADAGIAGRYAGSGTDYGNDTGQAEAWNNLNLRRAENQEAFDQAQRLLVLQGLGNAQALGNRQNQGGEATTQRLNAIQENSLMFDNDWLVAVGLRNPVFLDAIAARVIEVMGEKE